MRLLPYDTTHQRQVHGWRSLLPRHSGDERRGKRHNHVEKRRATAERSWCGAGCFVVELVLLPLESPTVFSALDDDSSESSAEELVDAVLAMVIVLVPRNDPSEEEEDVMFLVAGLVTAGGVADAAATGAVRGVAPGVSAMRSVGSVSSSDGGAPFQELRLPLRLFQCWGPQCQ